MKRKFNSKRIVSLILTAFLMFGVAFGVDFLPETKASAATTSSTISDLFHDTATYFISNIQPKAGESVTIRLRTVKGMFADGNVKLLYRNSSTSSTNTVTMTKASLSYGDTDYYEYWQASFTVPDATEVYYYFSVKNNTGTRYFYQYGNSTYNPISSSVNYTYGWKITPNVQTPDWAKGAVWYSLIPDLFMNGDPANDDYLSGSNFDSAWGSYLSTSITNKYGGDFQGIMDKIAYIQSLGVDGVYFNPVNTVVQTVGYGSYDFNQIESTFGNAQTYKKFINFMHDNGLRVMQDVAVYHTVYDGKYINNNGLWLNNGYSAGLTGPVIDYSGMIDNDALITTNNWGGKIINHSNPVTQQLLWSTADGALVRYVNDAMGFGVDGYRFDCGGWINGYGDDNVLDGTTAIMQQIRSAIKAVNPEAVVLSESSGSDQLNSGAWDAQWQNHMHTRAIEFSHGNITSTALANTFESQLHLVNRATNLVSHVQLNTHDKNVHMFNGVDNDTMTAAKLIQMTFVGSPSIYFGEETNFADSDYDGINPFNWNENDWNYDVMNFTKSLVELRNTRTETKLGAYYSIEKNDTFYSFGRFNENGATVTFTNTSGDAATRTVYVRGLGLKEGDILTDWFTGQRYTVNSSGNISLTVPQGGTILVSGTSKSSYTVGMQTCNLTETGEDYATVIVGGVDKTDEYKTNGYVSVPKGSSAELGNLVFNKSDSFTFSADVTFTAPASGNSDNNIGIAFGEVNQDNKIYKAGIAWRPYLSGGSQAVSGLVSGTSDSQNKWIKVWGGPEFTYGTENTVNMKIVYESGIAKFYFNNEFYIESDYSEYGFFSLKPIFFNYYASEATALDFKLSNIKVSGEFSDGNSEMSVDSSEKVTINTSGHNYTIESTIDSIKFVNTPAYGKFSYTTHVNAADGSGVVMIRDSLDRDSAYYAIKYAGQEVTIISRATKGTTPVATTVNLGKTGAYIRIERDENNVFRAYHADILSGSSWEIANSERSVAIDNNALAGYAALSGTMVFKNIGVVQLGDKIYYDGFDGNVLGSFLNEIQDSDSNPSGGYLTLVGGKTLTTSATGSDWTFKTKLAYLPSSENDYAGVVVKHDDDTFLVAGRIKMDGVTKLFVARSYSGELAFMHLVDDPNPYSEIIVQLQRIGTGYTAVYSYDGITWKALGGNVFYNITNEKPGITVFGTSSAKFDYVSFGDAINDGKSYNTPQSPGINAFELENKDGNVKLEVITGDWYDSTEGMIQTRESGEYQLAVNNIAYTNFKIEATFGLEGGSWAAINFGKSSYDSEVGDGYLLKYSSDNTLVLSKNGVQVASADITDKIYHDVDSKDLLRVVAECVNGRLIVYAGQDSVPVIQVDLSGYGSGYVSFCSYGSARFNNTNILSLDASMMVGGSGGHAFGGKNGIYLSGNMYYESMTDEENASRAEWRTFASPRGVAATNFIYIGDLTFATPEYYTGSLAQAGIIFGDAAVEDRYNDGIYLKYTSEGKLYLTKNGVNLVTPYAVAGAPTTVKLMVTKQNGVMNVYVDGGKSPVLTYTDTTNNGGAFTFVSNNMSVHFRNNQFANLTSAESIAENDLYDYWMNDTSVPNKGEYFEDDFSSATLSGGDYVNFGGEYWEFADDGTGNIVLRSTQSIIDNSAWESGVSYSGGMYSDFILNFRMNYKGGGDGWVAIGWRRNSPDSYHQSNGAYLSIGANSISRLGNYNLNEEELAYESSKSNEGVQPFTRGYNVWHNFSLVVQGDRIMLYEDGKLIYHGIDVQLSEGYIAFKSGPCLVEYDDIEIIPLVTRSAPVTDEATNVAENLKVNVGEEDYTSNYLQNEYISASADTQITFPNLNTTNVFKISAKLEKTDDQNGYFNISLGKAVYDNAQYEVVLRFYPDVSDAGSYSNVQLCLVSDDVFVNLKTFYIDMFSTSKSSYSIDMSYDNGEIMLWVDGGFAISAVLADLNVSIISTKLVFSSSTFGMKLSNLDVYGGAEIAANTDGYVDLSNAIVFVGENNSEVHYNYISNGKFELNDSEVYISNVSVVSPIELAAKFDVSSASASNTTYKVGFIIANATYQGNEGNVYLMVSQKHKEAYIYFEDTLVYTTDIMRNDNIGDDYWYDDDEEDDENSSFSVMKVLNLGVSLSAKNDVILTVEMDSAKSFDIANLSNIGFTNIIPNLGFTAKGTKTIVKDVKLLSKDSTAINDNCNISNGFGTIIDTSIDGEKNFSNINVSSSVYYFAGGTFADIPNGASLGFTLGVVGNETVKAVISKSGAVSLVKGTTNIATANVTAADRYEFVVGYENGAVKVWVDGVQLINHSIAITTTELGFITASASGTVVSDVVIWGNVSQYVELSEMINGTVEIVVIDNANGLIVIAPRPDSGYQLVAGSLKYTNTSGQHYVINRYDDAVADEFVIKTSGGKATITAQFVSENATSVSVSTIASGYHTDDTLGRKDGVRFLTRFYMPIGDMNPQKDNITVKYNGNDYTVADYGILIVPKFVMVNKGISELNFETKAALTAISKSAKNNHIFYYSEEYLESSFIIKIPTTTKVGSEADAYYENYYAREYVLRGYVTLRPVGASDGSSDIIVYGDTYTDSINAIMARIGSEG